MERLKFDQSNKILSEHKNIIRIIKALESAIKTNKPNFHHIAHIYLTIWKIKDVNQQNFDNVFVKVKDPDEDVKDVGEIKIESPSLS